MYDFHKTSYTVWKMSVFGVFLVRIFPHSYWIRIDTESIQSECGKIRTRKCPNTGTFHAVPYIDITVTQKILAQFKIQKFEVGVNNVKISSFINRGIASWRRVIATTFDSSIVKRSLMSSVQKFTHECFRSSQNSYIKELANYCRKITKFGGNIQVAHHSLGPSLPSRTETSAMATKNYVKTDIRVFCLGQVCSIFYFWPNIYFFL